MYNGGTGANPRKGRVIRMGKERQSLAKASTAPGIGDPFTGVRIEWHQIGGGWKPVTLHWHNYCEFEIVLTGTGVHTLNNVPLPVSRGSAYICMMDDFHKIRNAPDETMVMVNLKFSESMVREALLKKLYEIPDRRYCAFPEEDIAQVEPALELLKAIQNDPPGDPEIKRTILECTLNQIIALFLLHCPGEKDLDPARREQNRLQKAISYIHRNFKRNISQAEVAEQAGLSVNYFSSMFRQQMHHSYSEYLLNLKLNYARNLIVSEHVTKVQTITSMIGFSSTPYFIKVFRKKFDVSPKEMIDAVQKKDRDLIEQMP